jgi:hypothetical protein
MNTFQNNDIEIEITVTDSRTGSPIVYGSVSAATYRMTTMDRVTALVTKTVGSGVVIAADKIVVTLSQADTVQLNTVYYHELQIVSGGKHSTVVSDNITFNETVI